MAPTDPSSIQTIFCCVQLDICDVTCWFYVKNCILEHVTRQNFPGDRLSPLETPRPTASPTRTNVGCSWHGLDAARQRQYIACVLVCGRDVLSTSVFPLRTKHSTHHSAWYHPSSLPSFWQRRIDYFKHRHRRRQFSEWPNFAWDRTTAVKLQ